MTRMRGDTAPMIENARFGFANKGAYARGLHIRGGAFETMCATEQF